MGRKRGGDGPSAGRSRNQAVSLREESSGKTQADAASLLRVQHLQRLAAWAGGEAGVGPVGALLGRRLAANAEAAGVPVGASTFLCQRCETVLQPGFNCTIRIKNDKRKGKRRKKSNSCQNSVSYLCHFCGDQNLIWGSGKRIVTNLLSSRKSVSMDSTSILLKENSRNGKLTQSSLKKDEHGERPKSNLTKDSMVEGVVSSSVEISQLAADTDQEDITQKIVVESANEKCMHEAEPVSADNIKICESNVPLKAEYPVGSKFITPQKNKLTDPKDSDLIKMRSMQNSGSATSSSKSAPNNSGKHARSIASDSAQVSGSSRKRARKGWTTLKQIAEKDELEKKEKMGNFVIPFFMQ